MPIDTLAESLFPWSTLLRILKGCANDGTIKKRKQAMSMFLMLI